MRTVALENLHFAEHIRAGDRVMWGHSSAEPTALVAALLAQRASIAGATVFMHASFSGLVRPEHADCLRLQSLAGVGTHRKLSQAGVLEILPSHLSDVPELVRSGLLPIDVVLVQVSPPDANGHYSLGMVNDFQVEAIRRARVVIAEQNDQVPFTYCDPALGSDEIDILVPVSRPLIEVPPVPIGELERTIARHAVGYIDDGAIVQFGVGAIPDAVVASLAGHRNLGIHSGVIPDAALGLLRSGAVTNATKRVDTGISVTGAVWGTRALYDFVGGNREIQLRPLTHTHRAHTFANLPGFVSINSAIDIDLTGQVNVEVAGGVYLGAVGGAVDFVRATRFAPGGRSIIAMAACTQDGKVSKIVSRLPAGVVTVPRSDVDVIVTEYGAAELRGQTLPERARRLIAIAHPAFREALEREAHAVTRGGKS
jgi:acetyl-CoA hydrolase